MRGSVVDLAVGIIIGVAFSAVINSLVKDILMPPIGLALGKVDFVNLFAVLKQGVPAGPYLSLEAARSAGAVTLNYGVFVNTVISFIIIALVIFLIIKGINSLKKKEEAKVITKSCPYCFSVINLEATRCPNCTSKL